MSTLSVPIALDIHNIRLLNLTMEDAQHAIEAAIIKKDPISISFVNADCVNIASVNHEYRSHLKLMDWIFIDGIGMRIAGRILNQPVCDNVNGSDLFPLLCQSLTVLKGSVYLLGAQPGVADAVAHWATTHYPGLRIAGTQHGFFTSKENGLMIKRIRDSRPDVLLVAMGSPKQEAWINHYRKICGATVVIGVGGLFDYYSGRIPRAPLWMRNNKIEWVFRLIQEPRRLWQRYLLGNFVFMLRIGFEWLTKTIKNLQLSGGLK